MKWKKVLVENIIKEGKGNLVSGPFGSNISSKFFRPEGVPVIRGNNIPFSSYKFYDDGFVFISQEKAVELKNCIAINDDIIFTAAGTIGQVGIIPKDAKYPFYIISNKQIRLRCDEGKLSPLFAYYWFSSSIMKEQIQSFNSGSSIPLLTLGSVKKFPVVLPPLPTQRKIASILSTYDDLIENNLKRVKLLVEKARIEYKTIQKNEKLEFKKTVKVLQFSTGKLNSNAAVQDGLYPFFTCGQEILRTNTFSLDEEVVLLGGNNASAIYPVFYYKGKFDAYQRTYIIKPKPECYISFKYLYFFWEGKLDYLKNISTGAATKFLTLKILNDIDIPLPSKKVMADYETLTEPIFKLKAILDEQNTKLREARDILLPKLMSGQIEV
jgi:type I restriction enzyme S subunit